MPETGKFYHILDYLKEAGYYYNVGMGILPLTFNHINEWSKLTRTFLNIFEIESMLALSQTYVTKFQQFNNVVIADPFPIVKSVNREKVAESLKSSLRGMMLNYG